MATGCARRIRPSGGHPGGAPRHRLAGDVTATDLPDAAYLGFILVLLIVIGFVLFGRRRYP